ncbi:MAG: serine/threonine-protein kinase PknK [Myxococcales bacterium]|nr:serine/threonine-protein kinase PknK [Myxococcales bacterium]
MAEVWLGRHRLYSTDAALKVLAPDIAHDTARRNSLATEVRAMAGLDHPGIATVLDAGMVDAAAEAASGGAVVAGSPWLAVDWLPLGDLSALGAPLPWAVLGPLLRDILDALAHAHARGVVHRDLKPGNVLLRLTADRVRAVLTDFGIARLISTFDPEESIDRVAGTPRFMAPEQIRGRSHEIGPATDLYALGCLAYALTAGHPPFNHTDPAVVTTMHLVDPVPPLPSEPRRPAGFEAWVGRLLQKAPEDRFERAADAARALDALGGLPDEHDDLERVLARLAGQVDRSPLHADSTWVFTVQSPTRGIGFGDTVDVGGTGPLPTLPVVPSIVRPLTEAPPIGEWRDADPAPGLVARVGPALFGVRTLALVGRRPARDRLWQALRATRGDRRPRICLVTGAQGLGRRRLVDWLVQEADELGVADVLHARHGPIAAPGDGLAGALRRLLGGELDPMALAARLDRSLARAAPDTDPARRGTVARTLLELITAGALADRPGQRAAEFAALEQWMRWSSRRRTLIIRLDDAHRSDAALEFAARLEGARDIAALVVLTVRDGVAGAREAAQLDRLATELTTTRVALGPLDDDEMRELLVGRIGISPRLARPLAARAAGRPQFAVQVVADWLAAGALTPGAEGLDAEAPPFIPDDLDALGMRRIEGIVAAAAIEPERAMRHLEAAAALGEAVDDGEWRAITGAPGEDLDKLLAGLLDAGLARPATDGWGFAHRFVRDALVASARGAGRWAAKNERCAAVVADPDPTDPRPAERRGLYLAEAEHPAAAAVAFAEAARRALGRGRYRETRRLIDAAGEQLDAAAAAPDDPRRIRLIALGVETTRHVGDGGEARRRLDALIAHPSLADHPEVAGELARLDGQLSFYLGETERSIAAYGRAAAAYARTDDAVAFGRSLHGLGISLAAAGRSIEGMREVQRALAVAEAHAQPGDRAWALHALSSLRFWAGMPGRALAEQAAELFEQQEMVTGHAFARLTLGELLGVAGEATAARQHVDAATALLRAAESALLPEALLGSARLSLRLGEWRAALRDLAECCEQHLDRLNGHYRGEAALAYALCLHDAGELTRARAMFDRGAAEAERALIIGCPTAETLDRVALVFTRGDGERGARAWRLSARAWAPHDPTKARDRLVRAEAALTRGRPR